MGDGVADSGPGEALVPPVVDPELCKATAASLLDTLDGATLAWLEGYAVKAGADETTWKAFRERAELKPACKSVLVDTSPHWLPALLRRFGFDVGNAPGFLAGVALLQWSFGVGSAAAALNRKAKEKAGEQQRNKEAKEAKP